MLQPENSEQPELWLPYEDFTGKMLGRPAAREAYKRGPDTPIFMIPFKDIQIWDGYNAREIYEDIPELAESLANHGQKTPFKLILVKDRGAFLQRGGRRRKAYLHLIETGKFDPNTLVPFELVSTKDTMEEMILDLHTSNNLGRALKPIETATVAYRLKHISGKEKKNEDVAKLLGVSRQAVDNMITIASAPEHLKTQIRKGDITYSDGLKIIKDQEKTKKQADKKEEEAAQTSMYEQPGYIDPLQDEIEDLEALNLQADRFAAQQKERAEKEKERLERDAILVQVTVEALAEQVGKRLAADALKSWEDVAGENDATVTRHEVVLPQGQLIDEPTIEKLLHEKVETVYVFKEIQAAPSVITQLPELQEKSPYDESRPEIESIQKAIKGADKIEALVNKLDVPQGTKDDLSHHVHWLQVNLAESREWIHKHKQQNKPDR